MPVNNNATIALALGAGIVGGMLTRYISPPAVSAQTQPPHEMRAQSFVLVDPADHVVGTFTSQVIGNARLALNPDGSVRGDVALPRRVILRDSAGHIVWSTDSRVMPLRAE
jgi:hypothetical protein